MVFQECFFLWSACSPNRFIPRREAAKLENDVHVLLRELNSPNGCLFGPGVHITAGHESFVKSQSSDLTQQTLMMHERQIKEHLLHEGDLLVEPLGDCFGGHVQRFGVSVEGIGCAAIDVPAELIEQDDECKASSGVLGPVIELGSTCSRDVIAKLGPDLGVQFVILAEPAFFSRTVKPEGQQLVDGRVCGCRGHVSTGGEQWSGESGRQ